MVEIRHKTLGVIGAEKEEPMKITDLQSLIELGCIKEEVEIGNFKFVLRSLSASERISLSKEISEESKENEMFDFNVKVLAMAIESVNGKPLEELYPDNYNDALKAKMNIIASLQTPIISKLISVYSSLIDKCDKQFTLGQVKN